MRHASTAIIFFTLSLLFAACGNTFEPRSEINYLRVLGIRADQPTLSPGQGTRITALIGTVLPEDPYTLFWEFCAFTQGRDSLRECAEIEGVPPFEAESREFFFLYPMQFEPIVRAACEQFELDPDDPEDAAILAMIPEGVQLPNCNQEGFPGQLRLTATAPDGEQVVAVKTLYLRINADEGEGPRNEPNLNPQIIDFELAGSPSSVEVGKEYEMRCQINASSVEDFVRFGSDEVRREEILFSWFVVGGDFETDLTYFAEGESPLEDAEKNTVTPTEGSDMLTLWCVIRDGRGGIDWRRIDLPVEE